MKMKNKIDLYNSINVYTDASTTSDYGKKSTEITSSPGYVIVYNHIIRLHGSKIIYRTNSTYGEMYAILMGIKAVYREIISGRLPNNIPINIFTDSLSSIEILTRDTTRWYVLDGIIRKTSDDKQITDQDVVKKIIEIVNKYKIPINLYHIKSHAQIKLNKKANLGDKLELKKIREAFYYRNHINITDKDAAEICYYNIFVDNFTRYNMKENMRLNIYNNYNYVKPKLNNILVTKEDLETFYFYINGGE